MKQITAEELTLFTSFRVTSADSDLKARLRLGGLVNMLIQSAIQSADSLGFGFGGLRREKLFWVLSRMSIEIHRSLSWNQEVIVETWPKDIDGLLYLRDYIVRDKQQNLVAKSTSGWLAIDIETKRPKVIEGIQAEMLNYLRAKHALESLPEKLPGMTEGEEFEIASAYSDIDLNGHVTSTRYIDWMLDTLPIEFLQGHYPKQLSINYMKETMPTERIRIKSHLSGENLAFFEVTNLNKGTTAFRGKIGF